MNEPVRGLIRNESLKTQINDFSKLRFQNITPTDVDGCIEFSGRLFIFIELKSVDAPMPRGQALCLRRIADAISHNGRLAIVIHAEHDTPPDRQVQAHLAKVKRYYIDRQWRDTTRDVTVLEMVRYYHEKIFPQHSQSNQFSQK